MKARIYRMTSTTGTINCFFTIFLLLLMFIEEVLYNTVECIYKYRFAIFICQLNFNLLYQRDISETNAPFWKTNANEIWQYSKKAE